MPEGSGFEFTGKSKQTFHLEDGSRFNVWLTISSSGATILGHIYRNVTPPFEASFVARQTITESLRAQATTSEFAGRYTAVLVPNGTDAMAGVGAGHVVVGLDGKVRLLVMLPDGSVSTSGGRLDVDGRYSFAQRYNGLRGKLAGEIQFARGSDGDRRLRGEATWHLGPLASDPRYPAGFTVGLEALGEEYLAPASGKGVFSNDSSSSMHHAVVTHGPFTTSFDFELDPDGTATAAAPSDFRLRIQRETGLFMGRFQEESRMRKFRGAVLQQSAQGRAFYLTEDGSGRLLFEAAR